MNCELRVGECGVFGPYAREEALELSETIVEINDLHKLNPNFGDVKRNHLWAPREPRDPQEIGSSLFSVE